MSDTDPHAGRRPTVFISYSHDSDSHRERVLGLSERLRKDGIETSLDQYVPGTPTEGWPRWMLNQLDWARFVLVICTETYYRRFRGKEEGDKGKGADWEGQLITSEIYEAKSKTVKFVPILFDPADKTVICEPLRIHTFHLLNSEAGYQTLLDFLLGQAGVEPGEIGQPKRTGRKKAKPLAFEGSGTEDARVSIARLPTTGEHFLGRDDELTLLDGAWVDDNTKVFSIVAWGGVGKSALVNEWLARMACDHWRGAERVFAWTFYSQGARDTAASADQFIAKALEWFGDPDPTAGSPWDKGERLAKLVRRQRTLLLLDGLEPLQHPPHAAEPGRITDPALATLVRELALENPGLCVITTREPVADLAGTRRATTAQLDLAHLSCEAGVALLRELGVQGSDDELRQAVLDVRGHALTISLLGKYLVAAHGGDIRRRGEVRLHEADAEVQGSHAFKVMDAYEKWFLREGEKGRPLVAILRLLGLFDRPADAGCLAALRQHPPIPDLTEPLVDLTDAQWNLAVSRLASCGLVAAHSTSLQTSNLELETSLDSHPLVREHFGEQLRREFPAAWKEGHNQLYEHLKQAAPNLPDTLEEMMPLFAAVAHGCQAGRHQDAFDDVYRPMIRRGNEQFQVYRLGAFGVNLSTVANFLERLWEQPVAKLREETKAWLLNEAGFSLRALGRLAEAVEPMRAGLDARIVEEDWENGAISGANLSELTLTLGAVAEAQRYARQSIDLADRSGGAFWRMANRTTLADALHQAGRLDEAEALFREAEAMQKARQSEYLLLYSLPGYRYCDLLLTRAGFGLWLIRSASAGAVTESQIENRKSAIETCPDVQKRGTQTLEWSTTQGFLLDIALDHLSLGRALLLEHVLDPDTRSLDPAFGHLTAAVEGLRRAGTQDHLPRGLLARAALRRVSGDLAGAAHDLGEAQDLAERSAMRLFQADGLIEQAAQTIADCGVRSADWKSKARECVGKAKALVQETGYHCRDPEIQLLEQILAGQA